MPKTSVGDTISTNVRARREKRHAETEERRLQAEKAHQEDERRVKCARARFDAEGAAVLEHLREAAGRWQARQPQSTDLGTTQPGTADLIYDRIKDNAVAFERRLLCAAGDHTDVGRKIVLSSQTAGKIRYNLGFLAKTLDRHLALIGKLLPFERHAEFVDRIAPGATGPLYQLRAFLNRLESLEGDAVKLAVLLDPVVTNGRPRVWEIDEPILHLANVWLQTTGECPPESRSSVGSGATDKGEFSEWAIKTLSRLNPEVACAISSNLAPIAEAVARLKAEGYLPNKCDTESSGETAPQRLA